MVSLQKLWRLVQPSRRPCGFPTRKCKVSDEGLSLLEVVVSLALSSILVVVLIRMAFGIWTGTDAVRRQGESWAMSDSVERMLGDDCHSASRASVSGGNLYITRMDGQSFRYLVNSSGQLVRIGQTGGTSVVATQVAHWQATVADGKEVHIAVSFVSGVTYETRFSLLGGGV
jgi:hypothetical protein